MRIRRMIRIKPIVALLLSIAMIVSFCGCSNKSNNAQNENETEFQAYYEPLTSDDIATEGDVYYASSQMLLTSVNDATYEDIEKLIKKNGGEIVGYISATGDYQIRFNDSKTFEELEQLIENLKNDALIEDASLAYVAQFSNEAINYTNDPWIDADDPSDTSGSVWDEDNPDGKNWWAEAIDMPTVWSMDLSTQTVKVGIIDSMFDTTNEDLDENLFAKTWNNPTNDDGSCRVTQLYNDAVAAYDQAVLSKDQNAIDNASNNISNASHGTHVAGIIAAQADNGFGIAGVNQNVKLYGYSVLSDESTVSDEGQWGSIFQYKCAIAHLLNEGVKVINISMGYNDALMGTQDGDSYWSTFTSVNSKSLESFLLKYIEAGNEFLIVKSAGNDSSTDKKYDAGNDVFGAISNDLVSQRIIIVGATRYNTKYDYYPIADFSNTGSRVDVYAPGVDVLSDIPSNVTALKSGTSMSTPVVSGLASLIWGINPDLSAEQVRGFILASTSATMFDLDDESFIIRDLINWVADPTAIVNADICVQLAQATIGNGNNSDAEYGTVSGMVYAITSDESDFVDINIETLSLYNEKGALISTIPLQDIAYRVSDDDTGTVSILNLHTYSTLLEPGTYTLKAEVDGYDVQSHQITISPNDVVNVDFEFIAINGENYNSFADVIIDVQNRINYTRYPDPQKEYCRGDFFEIDGRNALVLMYYVLNGSDLTPGYYVGLWVENSNGTISCLTDHLIEEVIDPDDAYVTVNIRKIDGKMYLNSCVRQQYNQTDIWKNQYFHIGDDLVLEHDLYSEAPYISMGDGLIQQDESKSVYYLNQEQVDRSTFYSTQDKLNIRTFVLGINPNWSEGRPPEGYTFEELLAQLPAGTTSNDSGTNNSLTTELGLSADSAQSIVDVYVPFCKTLSDTYTSDDGSVANLHFCSVVEFTPDIPNLVVRYLNPYAGDPVEFYEAWLIYGIENGDVVEQFCYENYSPTRREIELIYTGESGYLLREIQTIAGAFENPTTILYPENITEEITYSDYWAIMWPNDENILRVWNTRGDYVDIRLTESMNQTTNAGKTDLSQYIATDVKNFSNMFTDLIVDKYSDGTQLYSNSYLFFDEDHNDKVYSISLNGESDFTICGLYYGMPFNEAYEILTKNNFKTWEDREGYLMVEGDGFYLSISAFYLEGETLKIRDNVSSVTIWYK